MFDPEERAEKFCLIGIHSSCAPACCNRHRESANIGGFGEALKVDIFLPGPASLVNHHAGLENGAFRNKPDSPERTKIFLVASSLCRHLTKRTLQ
jgi:hypothetical protein